MTKEESVKCVLTDNKVCAIKSMLEKDHAMDCLFLLLLNMGRWKDAKAFMHDLGLTISDGTFRARMMEIEDLGLATSVPIDPLKKYYVKNELGEKVAKILLDLFDKLAA